MNSSPLNLSNPMDFGYALSHEFHRFYRFTRLPWNFTWISTGFLQLGFSNSWNRKHYECRSSFKFQSIHETFQRIWMDFIKKILWTIDSIVNLYEILWILTNSLDSLYRKCSIGVSEEGFATIRVLSIQSKHVFRFFSIRFNALFPCCQIPQRSRKPGQSWTTNSTLCTTRELSSIGTSGKEWRKESLQKLVQIWLPWNETTKRWLWSLRRRMPSSIEIFIEFVSGMLTIRQNNIASTKLKVPKKFPSDVTGV